MKKFLLICFTCWSVLWASPAANAQSRWEKLSPEAYPEGERRVQALAFEVYQLDTQAFKQALWSAPHEQEVDVRYSPTVIELPGPDGQLSSFRLVQYDLLSPMLASRFPGIRTWRGIDKRDHRRTIYLDWTARGFHAAVRGPGDDWFIDPYLWADKRYYQTYYKRDQAAPEEAFVCHTDPSPTAEPELAGAEKVGDCRFRSYRTAIATTAEYSNFHGGTEALVQSAVTTTLNRVNGVYATDLAIRLVLIGNNHLLYYYNSATDPYTNGSGSVMLDENQANINLVIGSANYDIGHVFSTGGGGIAQLNSPCGGGKARGVTGRGSPVGDGFNIDYVAHEMGHQFGANHTQNNNCNYSPSAGMEPGSASTIMGYAGICSPNVQNSSDAYYHGISIQQIANYMELGGGNTCAATVSMTNGNPTISAGLDRTIPVSTPFMLSATAADPNGHPLTYCWEQWDVEQATHPPVSTNALGPMFRSFDPSPSPQRYFPDLSAIVNNSTPTWEVLPSVGRAMEFRVSVRDWDATNGYGCTTEDNIDLTVSAAAGPFLVTSPNTAVTWTTGTSVLVSWDIAGTDLAPVSCDNVDLLLSTDGGFTYPLTLATSVPNIGAAYVVVPNNLTTQARVMVRCSDNVFFDISNVNFTIALGVPTYSLSPSPAVKTICDNVDTEQYTISVGSFLGYSDPVSLSWVGALPTGAMASFSPSSVTPGGSAVLTLSNLDAVAVGSYTITIRGSSSSGTQDVTVDLVVDPAPATPVLLSPTNGAIDQSVSPVLSWQAANNALEYELEIATNPGFTPTLLNTTLSLTAITISGFSDQTTYYWRVRGLGSCEGDWATASFTTAPCFTYSSTDVPKSISGGEPSFITSVLPITAGGSIVDLDVVNVVGTHTWVGDLTFTLLSPANTSRTLVNGVCSSQDDFNFNVDDSGVLTAGGSNCPIDLGQTYTPSPSQALSVYQSVGAAGTWTLRVNDNATGDGGFLNSWGLRLCIANYSPLPVAWLSFSARPTQKHIQLRWATAMEANNLGFDLERRSEQAREWEVLAFVAGQGDATDVSHYSFADHTAQPGYTYYYRLRQIDVDGRDSYSEIRSANLAGENAALRVFPNPAYDEIRLESGATSQRYWLRDSYGRQLWEGPLSPPSTTIPIRALAAGVYWLGVEADGANEPQTIRFVKQ